jgi:outer membrane protein assembly factor BamB
VFALRSVGLVALSLATGARLWETATNPTVAPASDSERVYAAEGARLQAFDLATGHPVWQRDFDAAVARAPVAQAGWLLAMLETGTLVALRGDSGGEIWRRAEAETASGTPVIAGPLVLVPLESGLLVAIELASGATRWSRRLGGALATPLVLDGRVYIGGADNFVYCLDSRTGRDVWRWRTGGDIIGAPVYDDDHVFFVSLDNLVRAVDRRSGNLRWKQPLSSRALSGLLVVGSDLLVSGVTPDLRALSVATGRAVDRIRVPAELLAGVPHLVAGERPGERVVVVVGTDGGVYAMAQSRRLPLQPLTTLPGVEVPLTPPPGITAA